MTARSINLNPIRLKIRRERGEACSYGPMKVLTRITTGERKCVCHEVATSK